jgi:hypothetical protein
VCAAMIAANVAAHGALIAHGHADDPHPTERDERAPILREFAQRGGGTGMSIPTGATGPNATLPAAFGGPTAPPQTYIPVRRTGQTGSPTPPLPVHTITWVPGVQLSSPGPQGVHGVRGPQPGEFVTGGAPGTAMA